MEEIKIGKKYKVIFEIMNSDTFMSIEVIDVNEKNVYFKDKFDNKMQYRLDTIKSIRELK
jgi:hypothetical protein